LIQIMAGARPWRQLAACPSTEEGFEMTIAARAVRRDPTTAPPIDRGLIEAGWRNFEATALAQQHAAERLSRLCEEGLRFASQRMEENRQTLLALAAARTLPDTLSIWTGYFERTTRQYSEEFELVAGLCSEQAREAVGDLRQGVAAGVDAAGAPGKA
jgi:hypothetical protein